MFFIKKRLRLYLGALLVVQIFTCIGFGSSIRSGAIDFRSYYTAGYMLRTGRAARLYGYPAELRLQNEIIAPAPAALPFFAPPFTTLLFAPLSFASYRWALLMFGICNIICLGLVIRALSPHLAALSARWPPLPILLFFSFLPVGLTLMMGQISILLLLVDCLAFTLLCDGSPFLAGLVLSLALIKFQTAFPIALLFLLWRRWRFTLGFLTGAAALIALSILIIGPRGLAAYLQSITHMSALAGTPLQGAVGTAPRAMANLYGLFFVLAPSNHMATILTLAASVVLIAWAATRRPSLPLALLVATLVSYHLYPCDLSLLLLPIGLLCNRLFAQDAASYRATKPTRIERYRRAILLCSLGAFLISPLVIEIINNNVIFLLSLPILGLVFTPHDWSTFTLPRASRAHYLTEIQVAA